MAYSNKLAYFLAYNILREPDSKDRGKIWAHIVKLGKVCTIYNSYLMLRTQ